VITSQELKSLSIITITPLARLYSLRRYSLLLSRRSAADPPQSYSFHLKRRNAADLLYKHSLLKRRSVEGRLKPEPSINDEFNH